MESEFTTLKFYFFEFMIPHGTCAVRTAVLDNGEGIFVRVDGDGESESVVAFKIKMFGNQVAISKLAQLSPL